MHNAINIHNRTHNYLNVGQLARQLKRKAVEVKYLIMLMNVFKNEIAIQVNG